MKSKKLKSVVLLAFIIYAASINNTVFADLQTDLDSAQQKNTQINAKQDESAIQQNKSQANTISTTLSEPDLKTFAESPAVEVKSDKSKKEEHLVPVLELKGAVREEEPSKKESALKAWLNGNYATGNWGGLRTKLEEHGITVNSYYFNGDYLNLGGGKRSATHLRTLGLIDTSIGLDTEKMGMWKGGKFQLRYQNKHGLGLTQDFIGDYQLLEVNDTPRFNEMNEYWYQQSLFNDHFKIKLGRQDANTDFSALYTGFNHANASFIYMPTIPLSSCPYPSLGVTTTLKPFVDWLSIKSGFFDGTRETSMWGLKKGFDGRDGALIINEIGINHSIKNYPGNYFCGHWIHTGSVEELTATPNPRTFGDSMGWYLGGEQMIFKENNDAKDDQGMTVLGQFGWAPSDRTQVSRYYGTSVQYKGIIPKRNKDIIGMGTAIAGFSNRLKDIPGDGRKKAETALDMFYKIQLTPWLAVQPDVQFIFRPNGKEKNAFVMGIRTLISF